jgi:hypothetical protein
MKQRSSSYEMSILIKWWRKFSGEEDLRAMEQKLRAERATTEATLEKTQRQVEKQRVAVEKLMRETAPPKT